MLEMMVWCFFIEVRITMKYESQGSVLRVLFLKGDPPEVGALGIIRIHRYERERAPKHRIDSVRSVV